MQLFRRSINANSIILPFSFSILIALGLVMDANRAAYVYFVIGSGSLLAPAAVVAMLGYWFLPAAG